MNNTKWLTDRLAFAVCTGLLGALTGCASYTDQPRARGGDYPQAPPPLDEASLQPSAVQFEASDGSTGVSIHSESDFYEPLTPYGRWEVVGSYGRCWIPGRVEADWRPYGEGYWQRTDAGWYWVSDEPWAWATYHYGCWDLSPQYGWYWVPQTQWAPAWVSWHSGGGYIGWTPRYPSGVRVTSERAYVFVEERHFMEPVRRSTVVVNNTTIINTTVINQAPSTTLIERASGRKVQAFPVQELRHKTEATVVATQRSSTPVVARNVGTPARDHPQPAERKTVAAQASPQLEQPTASAQPSAAQGLKNHQAQTGEPNPAPSAANAYRTVKPPARAPSGYPAAMQQSTQRPQAQANSVKPLDKQLRPPAKDRPAANEKNQPNASDQNHESKGKD